MSAELPLSIRTLLVLNPSIRIMITRGSLWGYFTPLASSSEKHMSWLIRLCFSGGRPCTLFTCLWYDFLREWNKPPMVGPPVIVFISPSAVCGRGCEWSSSLRKPPCWPFCPYLAESPFFTYCCNFPLRISSSICSFRSLQSSV